MFGPFYTTHYINTAGDTRAQILLTWTEPDNTDGSSIIDGSHYEIRYRPNATGALSGDLGGGGAGHLG